MNIRLKQLRDCSKTSRGKQRWRRRRLKRKSNAGPLVSGGLAVGGGGRPGIPTFALFPHRRMRLDGGGESRASSSMKNKLLRPLLYLVMVFLDHDCGLVRVWFPVTFI
ncbi:hypothetical protein EJB05_29238, partial [Eragrostis curvula]